LIVPNKLLDFSLLHFLLIGFVYGLLGKREREHEGIGVPDRTRERIPGSDTSCYLAEPFLGVVGGKPHCSGWLGNLILGGIAAGKIG
jgi:hypothetical protein